MRLILPLLLLLLGAAGGCQPPEPKAEGPVPSDFIAQKQACEKRGGRWGTGGAEGFFVCYERTRDGGKSCTKAGDCESLCLARSQTCAPVRPIFGCQDVLTANGSRSTVCRD